MQIDPATIGSLGFPIAVAAYLLFRMEKTSLTLITTLQKLVATGDAQVKATDELRVEIRGLNGGIHDLCRYEKP